jgi:hypothetical protein
MSEWQVMGKVVYLKSYAARFRLKQILSFHQTTPASQKEQGSVKHLSLYRYQFIKKA